MALPLHRLFSAPRLLQQFRQLGCGARAVGGTRAMSDKIFRPFPREVERLKLTELLFPADPLRTMEAAQRKANAIPSTTMSRVFSTGPSLLPRSVAKPKNRPEASSRYARGNLDSPRSGRSKPKATAKSKLAPNRDKKGTAEAADRDPRCVGPDSKARNLVTPEKSVLDVDTSAVGTSDSRGFARMVADRGSDLRRMLARWFSRNSGGRRDMSTSAAAKGPPKPQGDGSASGVAPPASVTPPRAEPARSPPPALPATVAATEAIPRSVSELLAELNRTQPVRRPPPNQPLHMLICNSREPGFHRRV